MTAHLLCQLFDIFRDRVGVFLHDFFADVFRNETVHVEMLTFGKESFRQIFIHQGEAFDRIFVCKAFSTGELVKSVVRSVGVNVVFNQDGLAVVCLNHRGCHVAVGKLVGAHHLFGDFLAIVRWRAHRDEIFHPVAAVDVKHLADRA